MNVFRHPTAFVAVTFIAFGSFIGSLAVSIADLERALGVSHAVFGALMALSLVFGGLCSALVSVRVHRRGIAPTLRECLLAWALILVCLVLVPTDIPVALAVLFILATGGAGAVDVVMQTEATNSVNGEPGGLLRIHAMFCVGAAIGAIGCGTFLHFGWNFRGAWIGTAVLCLLLMFRSSTSHERHVGDDEEDVPLHAAMSSLAKDRLLLVAAAFLLGAIVEGGIDSWGPLYLRNELHSGTVSGAAAPAIGYLMGFTSRMSLSFLSNRIGAKYCALFGTFVSVIGLIILVASHSVVPAVIGIAFAVGGITANWPLLTAYATHNNPQAALVTGGLSTAGYTGLVIGPAVLGSIASLFTLRTSLCVVAILAMLTFVIILRIPRKHASAIA